MSPVMPGINQSLRAGSTTPEAQQAMNKDRPIQMFCYFLVAWLGLAFPLTGQTLKKIGVIDLSGPKGERFDYLTMDDEDHYLLSAHLGPGILYVIDVRTNQLVKAIPGVPGITGLEYVPGLRKVYTSDWGENKIGVVDLRTMSVIKRLPTGEKPNGSACAAPFRYQRQGGCRR
jgi:YVTN family beta-propeller protein